jgi:hypothetical protein
MKKNLKMFLLLSFLIFGFAGSNKVWCQGPPPSDCTPGHPDYDEENCIPIDGGLAILLLAGAGYGVRKYRSSGKDNSDNTITAV